MEIRGDTLQLQLQNNNVNKSIASQIEQKINQAKIYQNWYHIQNVVFVVEVFVFMLDCAPQGQQDIVAKPPFGVSASKYQISIIRFTPEKVGIFRDKLTVRFNDDEKHDKVRNNIC